MIFEEGRGLRGLMVVERGVSRALNRNERGAGDKRDKTNHDTDALRRGWSPSRFESTSMTGMSARSGTRLIVAAGTGLRTASIAPPSIKDCCIRGWELNGK